MNAVVAALVALAGVGLAWLHFYGPWWSPWAIVLVIAGLGFFLFWKGRRILRGNPVLGRRLMEWIFLPKAAVAVAGSAGIIIFGALVATKESMSDETKALIGALSAAVATFLAAALIEKVKTFDKSWVGDEIKKSFEVAFKDVFKVGSEGRDAVYSGLGGDWSRANRRERAKTVDEALKDPAQLK